MVQTFDETGMSSYFEGREKELRRIEEEVNEKLVILKIAEWLQTRDLLTNDVLIRFRLPITVGNMAEQVLKTPEKFCTVESQPPARET
jgi:hypothetical protein